MKPTRWRLMVRINPTGPDDRFTTIISATKYRIKKKKKTCQLATGKITYYYVITNIILYCYISLSTYIIVFIFFQENYSIVLLNFNTHVFLLRYSSKSRERIISKNISYFHSFPIVVFRSDLYIFLGYF